MSRKFLSALGVVLVLLLALSPNIALAHQTIKIGDYDVEYGWVNEPVIVNQPNAVVINITKSVTATAAVSSARAVGSISLMSPADGATIQGDHTDVMVMFSGLPATAAADGVHWHLMLDNQTLSMVPLDQTTVTVMGLTNGSHTVVATLADASHDALGQPATAKITVAGGATSGTPSATGVMTMTMGSGQAAAAPGNVDVSNLKVEAIYGPETKVLTLQPLGENTPGQFVAPLLPTKVGQITIRLSGKIDNTNIPSTDVQPEEVKPADTVQFPKVAVDSGSQGLGLAGWLGVAGIVLGLLGTVLGAAAFMRRR